jgi:hypothetical protein
MFGPAGWTPETYHILHMSDVILKKAPKEIVYLRAKYLLTDWSDVDAYDILSEPIQVKLDLKVQYSQVEFVNDEFVTGLDHRTPVDHILIISFWVELKDEYGNLLIDYTPPMPRITILKLPPLHHNYYEYDPEYVIWINEIGNGGVTNEFGEIEFFVYLNWGMIGEYIVAFDFGTSQSFPV